MPGPAPKPAAQRQRRNLRSTVATVDAPVAQRPEIPEDFHDQTKMWWATIWGSPISEEWVDADVPGLVALAQLVEDFWRSDREHRTKAHAEVRMASREYGLSPFSRRQLQWEVRRVEAGRPAPERPAHRPKGPNVLSALQGGRTA